MCKFINDFDWLISDKMELIRNESTLDKMIYLDAQQFADLCVRIIKDDIPPNVKEYTYIYNSEKFIIEEKKGTFYIVYLCN